MATSPATLLVVSHDRRLLETVCDKLWVVDHGSAVPFDGGYKRVAGGRRGWLDRGRSSGDGGGSAREPPARRSRAPPRPPALRLTGGVRRAPAGPAGEAPPPPPSKKSGKKEKLSKEAYRRQKVAAEAELTRLGLRKNHLELSMGDPAVQANFVEMRRVTSELADIDVALAAAEDAWLELEERAP